MKKIVLSFVIAASLMMGATACNSTKDATTNTDTSAIDTAKMRRDTTITDTINRKYPDTTRNNGQ